MRSRSAESYMIWSEAQRRWALRSNEDLFRDRAESQLESQFLKIAVPWSLSHYIPLRGFDPLYRALFDHAPTDISLIAWDNVKLCQHFARNRSDRARVSSLAASYERERGSLSPGSVASRYADHLYPPDRVLTEALCGDVEFHHTSPFPSLTRPFVFHCEFFAPVFFPCMQRRPGQFGSHDELRQHYLRLFANPLCQGLYSHIPETLDSIGKFFSNSAIEAKLFSSKIGLSRRSVDPGKFPSRKCVDEPRFLFIDSAHQTPATFFDRGGHVALRFWKEFRSAERDGMLILCCGRPDDSALASHGVDPAFIRSELGRSILWEEGHLANDEMNALMADAHFSLMPSASLHSTSILLAMTLGTVPIVTATPGTSVYVTDWDDAVVLRGVRDEIWRLDPDIGVLVDSRERMSNVAASLVTQLVERVFELLDSPEAFLALSHRTAERARISFSGKAFASEFWDSVTAKARESRDSRTPASDVAKLAASLQNCTLDQETWSRVFESSAQPMSLLDTGTSTIAELGGVVVHVAGHAPTNLADWSVFARYYSASAPDTIFAKTLVELDDAYFPRKDLAIGVGSRKWARTISTSLMRFPKVHALASRSYRIARKVGAFANLWVKYIQYKRGRVGYENYTYLVMENIHNFNIMRSFHKYYAIPCGEGPFVVAKAEKRMYSKTFSAYSLDRAVVKINRRRVSYLRKIASNRVIAAARRRIGEDTFRALTGFLRRKHTIGESDRAPKR